MLYIGTDYGHSPLWVFHSGDMQPEQSLLVNSHKAGDFERQNKDQSIFPLFYA